LGTNGAASGGGGKMKYAIFSDIHGNIHALKAALADAEKHGADTHLFVGDYAASFPWGNDVVNEIRNLKNAVVIRGNGEDYFIPLQNKHPNELTCEQFKPVYWAFNTLSKDNLNYLLNLPETAVITDGNVQINLAHISSLYFRKPKVELFHSLYIKQSMEASPFTHKEYLSRAKEALLTRPDALADIRALPEGIYITGHNHLQFYMKYHNKLFINPGSCGEALDCETTAAYTLLTIINDKCTVTERRVEYDLTVVAKGLDITGYSAYTPAWSNVMKLELFTGKDYFMTFVLHLKKTAENHGKALPISNDLWAVAVKTWEETL
jgi:predicted phosphodiesterase